MGIVRVYYLSVTGKGKVFRKSRVESLQPSIVLEPTVNQACLTSILPEYPSFEQIIASKTAIFKELGPANLPSSKLLVGMY